MMYNILKLFSDVIRSNAMIIIIH